MNKAVIPVQSASAEGQISIPIATSKRPGTLEKAALDLRSLCGLLTAPKSASLEEMDNAGAAAAAAKHARKNEGD